MSAVAYPLKLLPRYLPKPWGGRRMEDLFGRPLPSGVSVGESWELYDRPDGASIIGNGPLAGHTVAELRGNRPIPLLTKILDARSTLSVQVHPDEEASRELDAESKSEAWYVIEAAPGAKVYKGLCGGVRAPDLLEAIAAGRVADCLHSFSPRAGDVIFLPAGTVHALGAGLLLFEVQQNSDTTYRLYDWGRDRPLQVREAMICADFTGPGLDLVEPTTVSDDGRHHRARRVSSPWFVLEEHEALGLVTFETERRNRETWHVLFVLAGEGEIRPFRRGVEGAWFVPGDSILLPSEYGEYELAPRPGQTVRLLSAFVP
jgi:mannose-6-phosphate isomerase